MNHASMKFLLLIVNPLILLAWPSQSHAYPSTNAEFAKLPKYCSARFKRPGSNPEFWKSKLGWRNWVQIHHYCNALNDINIAAVSLNPKKREKSLTVAIRSIKGVLEKTEPTFILRPELYLKMGESYSQLQHYFEAITAYKSALKIKSNYSSAYASMSDAYLKMGERDKAIETLNIGLKYKPNSKRLIRRLERLNK